MPRYNNEEQNKKHDELLTARLRKITAEAEMKEQQKVIEQLKKEKLQRELIPLKDIIETFIQIGTKTKSQLQRLIGELPSRAEGLPAQQIEDITREFVDSILNELYDSFKLKDINPNSAEFNIIEDDEEKDEDEL